MKSTYARSPEVVAEDFLGEGVLVLPAKRRSWVLNPVGFFIWRSCDGRTGAEEIAVRLARKFGLEASRVQRDVVEFCRELHARGLLGGSVGTVAVTGRSGPKTLSLPVCYMTPGFLSAMRVAAGGRPPRPRGGSGDPY